MSMEIQYYIVELYDSLLNSMRNESSLSHTQDAVMICLPNRNLNSESLVGIL